MTEYFYTLDLGDKYGPKLERLAEITSHDDREEFAAIMLARAIDHLERTLKNELDNSLSDEDCRSPNEPNLDCKVGSKGPLSLDDDIPL